MDYAAFFANHSEETKNARHRLTYSEDMKMARMLEDAYDFIKEIADINGLVLPNKPSAVKAELDQRKADRAIRKAALNTLES